MGLDGIREGSGIDRHGKMLFQALMNANVG